jgi:hypothetical protein
MTSNNDFLIRIVIDTTTNPHEWDLFVRYTVKSPWAFLTSGKGTDISIIRRNAMQKAEEWSRKVFHSSIHVDYMTPKDEVQG